MNKHLCAFSVALNIALVAFIVSARMPIVVREVESESHSIARRPRVDKRHVTNTTNRVDGILRWSQIESADYADYIANLRAVGCPGPTIRDIIFADVDDFFEQRCLELVKDPVERFWDFAVDGKAMEKMVSQKYDELNDLHREKKALLEKLLGSAYERKSIFEEYSSLGGRLGFLSPEKREQVLALHQSFAPRWEFARGVGNANGQRSRAIMEVGGSMATALARILSPEELEEYELQLSPAAHALRKMLESFEPTEAEFRQIYAIQRPLVEGQGISLFAVDSISDRDGGLIAKRVKDSLVSVLAPQRQTDFVRSQNGWYRHIYTCTERLGLSRATAVQLYDIKREVMEKAEAIKADRTMAKDERERALGALKLTLAQRILGITGTNNYDVIKQNMQ